MEIRGLKERKGLKARVGEAGRTLLLAQLTENR